MYPGTVDIIGSKETVFDYSVNKCDVDNFMDGAAHFFKDASGTIQVIVPSYSQWRMTGNDFNSLTVDCGTGQVHSSHMDSTKANHNYAEWLFSPYTTDGKTIYSLMHNEYHGYDFPNECSSSDVLKCWYNSITSAVSTDTGKTYTHSLAPSHLVASVPYVYNKDHGYRQGAFSPSNIIKHQTDGYYYAFFHTEEQGLQEDGLIVMRTNDLSDPSSWRMYDGNGFSTQSVNPYTDSFNPADHVFTPIAGYKSIGRVVWSTYFQKYLMVFNSVMEISAYGGMTEGAYYALSDDLIHWSAKKLLYRFNNIVNSASNAAGLDYGAYPSIVDHSDTSRNFEIIGQEAYLYYTKWTNSSNSGSHDRDLVRIKVRFNKNMVSGFTVNGTGNQEDTNPGDGVCETSSGVCSFYAAIMESNGRLAANADTILNINFALGSSTINATAGAGSIPTSQYPVNINGFSQSGSSPNTNAVNQHINTVNKVRINMGGQAGLSFNGGNTTIKGLVISNTQAASVTFSEKGNNTISGCFIGTDLNGTANQSETYDGQGIVVDNVANVTIGGENPEDRNLIVGGIKIKGSNAANITIKGNYIGTDYTGTQDLEQSEHGVQFSDSASNITLGGNNFSARNLISGNNRGVNVEAGSDNINIINNYIGVSVDGTASLGNTAAGISMAGSSGLIAYNVIGNNATDEAEIWLSGNSNVIKNNWIGIDSTLNYNHGGASSGIVLMNGAANNIIGGTTNGEGNIIANNGGDGISIFGTAGEGNAIIGNSIYDNASFAIDHDGDDQAATDIPTISLASKVSDSLLVSGTFSGDASTTYRLEFFSNNNCSGTGYGEGRTYLGYLTGTTNASGDLSFGGAIYAPSIGGGESITSTATGTGKNTTEFSACYTAATGVPDISFSQSTFTFNVSTGNSSNQSLTINNNGTADLNWSETHTTSWLSCDQNSGTINSSNASMFNLNVSTSGLSLGTYYDTITVASNDPYHATSYIYVQFNITAPDIDGYATDTTIVQISPNKLEAHNFWIKNTGNSVLTYTAGMSIGGKVIKNLSPTNGSIAAGDSAQFNFNINSNGQANGTYNEFIWISSNDPDEHVIELNYQVIVDLLTSAEQVSANNLYVYTANNSLNINTNGDFKSFNSIVVNDILGKTIKVISNPGSSNNYKIELPTNGIYFVNFYSNNEVIITKKVIY